MVRDAAAVASGRNVAWPDLPRRPPGRCPFPRGRDNGIEPEPVMLSYWRDLKEHEIAHRDEDVTIAGFHLGRRGMMRLENASVRMAVDRLHALGIPLTVMYAEIEA